MHKPDQEPRRHPRWPLVAVLGTLFFLLSCQAPLAVKSNETLHPHPLEVPTLQDLPLHLFPLAPGLEDTNWTEIIFNITSCFDITGDGECGPEDLPVKGAQFAIGYKTPDGTKVHPYYITAASAQFRALLGLPADHALLFNPASDIPQSHLHPNLRAVDPVCEFTSWDRKPEHKRDGQVDEIDLSCLFSPVWGITIISPSLEEIY